METLCCTSVSIRAPRPPFPLSGPLASALAAWLPPRTRPVVRHPGPRQSRRRLTDGWVPRGGSAAQTGDECGTPGRVPESKRVLVEEGLTAGGPPDRSQVRKKETRSPRRPAPSPCFPG